MFNRRDTVSRVVLDHSECAGVFQRHRIDFCCRGNVSIETAAQERDVDTTALLVELDRAVSQRTSPPQSSPRDLSTNALVEHIVTTHHHYLREVLPFVCTLSAKVRHVHGDHNPKLHALDEVVQELTRALLPHLDEEEAVLFPALIAGTNPSQLAEQLAAMLREHLDVAALLERMRAASDDYAIPDWACNSYRTLFSELSKIETDTFTHVHLENHVLMPRFTH